MLMKNATEAAQDNYVKHRGSAQDWFQHKADYSSPRPCPRVRPEASQIVEKHLACEAKSVVQSYKMEAAPEPIPVRLRDAEAIQIANKYNNQPEKWFDFEGNIHYKPSVFVATAVKSAQGKINKENLDQSKSSGWFDHTKPPPTPKVYGQPKLKEKRHAVRDTKADWFKQSGNSSLARSESADNLSYLTRTRPEAADYAIRDKFSNPFKNNDNDAVVVPQRCRSVQALENRKNEGSAIQDCIKHSGNQSSSDVSNATDPRVRSAAGMDNYIRNRGTVGLLEGGKASSCENVQQASRTRPEAEPIKQRNQGQMSQWFDQKANVEYSSPRPVPRLKNELAQQIAEKQTGAVMDSIISKNEYRSAVYKPVAHPQPRGAVSKAAADNREKHVGSSMKELVSNTNLKAEPCNYSKKGMADAYGKSEVNTLFSSYGKLDPDAPPAMRIRPEAMGNAEKHTGNQAMKSLQYQPPSDRV